MHYPNRKQHFKKNSQNCIRHLLFISITSVLVSVVVIPITLKLSLSSILFISAMSMSSPTTTELKSLSSNVVQQSDAAPNERNHNYDVIIIGGGSAGLTAAKLIGPTLQKSCCIIEQDKMGGDCTWTGCIPSKSFIASSKLYYNQHYQYQQQPSTTSSSTTTTAYIPPLADLSSIKADIQRKILQIYDEDDSPEALQKIGDGSIDVISGTANIVSSNEVHVGTETSSTEIRKVYAKEGVIVCTGAEPKLPTMIPGLENANMYYTYENIWTKLSSIPKQLTIIGGGPIGCEMAQAMARFGSKVTIITSSFLPQFDMNDDKETLECLQNIFEKKYNITLLIGRVTKVDQVTASSAAPPISINTNHAAHVTLTSSSVTTKEIIVSGDAILVAIGRKPRINKKLLGEIELTDDQSAIKVNDQLQTSIKNIYAAGDCTGNQQFTHYAGYQGAIAARNLLLPFTDPGILESVPSTIYASPEIATIGISETMAKERYGSSKIIVYKKHLSHVDRAICDSTQDGLIKIICLKSNQHILGATIIAPVAGEMISEIAILMKLKISFDKLATVMHTYPSYSMALQLMAAEVYYEKTMKLKWLLDILKKLGF